MAAEQRQSTPRDIKVTGFPWCAKAIVPGTGELTDNAGKYIPQHVYAGGAGDVAVVPYGNLDADSVIFTVPAGGVVPVMCRKVLSVGTTATGIVGLF